MILRGVPFPTQEHEQVYIEAGRNHSLRNQKLPDIPNGKLRP